MSSIPHSNRVAGILVLLACCTLYGCAIAKSAGDSFVDGATQKLAQDQTKKTLVTLEAALVDGLRDPLLGPETREKLHVVLTQALADVDRGLKRTENDLLDDGAQSRLGRARDTLVGPNTQADVAELRETLVGAKTNKDLGSLRDTVLGEKTKSDVDDLVQSALGDSTKTLVFGLREELIGKPARDAIDALVARTKSDLEQLKPDIKAQEDQLRKQLTRVIVAAGSVLILVLVVAWLIYRRGRRMARLLEVLTANIDGMRDPQQYDQLTQGISKLARERNLEPLLRKILVRQGINDAPSRAQPADALA